MESLFPPFIFLDGSRRWDEIRFKLETPSLPDMDWTNQLGGNSMGGGALFGNYRFQATRISDEEIESDYHWRQFKEDGYKKSVQQWKKEARLIFETVERVMPVTVPIDVEIEVPDPEKVRELLKNGTL
jgi:hypothetical protein